MLGDHGEHATENRMLGKCLRQRLGSHHAMPANLIACPVVYLYAY